MLVFTWIWRLRCTMNDRCCSSHKKTFRPFVLSIGFIGKWIPVLPTQQIWSYTFWSDWIKPDSYYHSNSKCKFNRMAHHPIQPGPCRCATDNCHIIILLCLSYPITSHPSWPPIVHGQITLHLNLGFETNSFKKKKKHVHAQRILYSQFKDKVKYPLC